MCKKGGSMERMKRELDIKTVKEIFTDRELSKRFREKWQNKIVY